MPDKFHKELLETVSQVRAVLEDFQSLGISELTLPSLPAELPVCLPGEPGPEEFCRRETLEEIRADLGDCRRCPLCERRNQIVFGTGNRRASLVFVGEAPGREEDLKGEPFVGEAGRLLDRILFAIGLHREDIYICNVIKCRPPGNRDPQPEEVAVCESFLKRQLASIRPRLIVTLGRFAAQSLLRSQTPISRLRGVWQSYEGIPLMPTYHPAFLLRNPAAKRDVWEDMKQVRAKMRGEEG
ncbi:MAG: uracil-DNA glycosylase [Syntrophotaleaceae bacterium]